MTRSCDPKHGRSRAARRRVALTLALALAAPAPPPAALAGTGPEGDRVAVRLLAGVPGPGAGRTAGLEIALAEGWKTYWRQPGDAGLPPIFDWTGSSNVADVEIDWPAPAVFDSFGLRTLGYGGVVTLPLRVTPVDPARPLALRLGLDFGVCAEVCIPERVDLVLDIAPDAPPEGAVALAAAALDLPRPAAAAGLTEAVCRIEGAGADRRFSARLAFDPPAPAPEVVVVEGPDGVSFGAATVTLEDGAVVARADAAVAPGTGWIARDALRLTLIGAGGAIELAGCAAPPT
jgi:DsbC/DsbD-like thiol-disulfide interchange protein